MKLRIAITLGLAVALAVACGQSKQGSTGASGSTGATSSGSTSGGTSGTSGKSCSFDTDCGGSQTCDNGACIASHYGCDLGSCEKGACGAGYACQSECCVPAGSGSTTSGTSGTTSTTGTSGVTGTSGSCALGACTWDNDCGGKNTCYGGCCVVTSDTCNSGSCAYGPCAPGWSCDGSTDCCVPDGGSSAGTSGGTTSGGACQFDGGTITSGYCNPDCTHGFHCENGTCVLNGGNGPIQVTLRYGNFDDLDLHVVQPDQCEVWYGNTDCPNGGSLDLDSNAGCGQSTVDAENVIYTPLDAGGSVPPSGTYTVRVDMYENCDQASSIPYEVIVRHNGTTDTYCMGFDGAPGTPYPGDNGSAGSGVTVATFTYP